MPMKLIANLVFCCFLLIPEIAASQKDTARTYLQFPSPMSDTVRKHERVPQKQYEGMSFDLTGVLPKTVEVFIPTKSVDKDTFDLLIHFLGASYVVKYAAEQYEGDLIAAFVHLGSGSAINGKAFLDSLVFPRLVDSLRKASADHLGRKVQLRRVVLSGWSAGYGAVRQILSTSDNFNRVDDVLLLDGIHASYVPEGKVLAEGGRIDSTHLRTFLKFSRESARTDSRHRFLITHSEIFPGTYASTTEANDYLLNELGIKRQAVLAWGPLGMQQLSLARVGHFQVMGFAGNTAPDHVDHFHALFYFLNLLATL